MSVLRQVEAEKVSVKLEYCQENTDLKASEATLAIINFLDEVTCVTAGLHANQKSRNT